MGAFLSQQVSVCAANSQLALWASQQASKSSKRTPNDYQAITETAVAAKNTQR